MTMPPYARVYAVRGAVCCENTKEAISLLVPELYQTILERNSFGEADIVSVQFTVTADITALNPATALRLAGLAANVPLFASAEPSIEGALASVVRILVTYYGLTAPVPVYLNGAEALRPDLDQDARGKRSH